MDDIDEILRRADETLRRVDRPHERSKSVVPVTQFIKEAQMLNQEREFMRQKQLKAYAAKSKLPTPIKRKQIIFSVKKKQFNKVKPTSKLSMEFGWAN